MLDRFSWEIPPGKTVLLGPNGAGKSTLLGLGTDALRPTQGRVRFGDVTPSRRRDRSAYRRLVGWMPQHTRAVPGLTAHEQVAYAAWLKGLGQRQAWSAAADALKQVGLHDLAGRKVSTLSGGQVRRIGLAQMLAHDAQVLLLDEPTAGLDPAQRARFRDLMAALPQGRVVVVSTHQVDDLSELFQSVVILDKGRFHFTGSVTEFLELAPAGAVGSPAEAAYACIVAGES
ncbi:MAG TPA: ATP-binding cassette domain-containing protein [Thermomicrobiaceae bacterium]|nr:ATP-binding cassette domain-containing protein [Thermomicrobiaceae bacterium]